MQELHDVDREQVGQWFSSRLRSLSRMRRLAAALLFGLSGSVVSLASPRSMVRMVASMVRLLTLLLDPV